VTVTVTPGNTALLSSVTRPLSSAVACALAADTTRRRIDAPRERARKSFMEILRKIQRSKVSL
jgi:hypothetical protein